MRRQNRQMAALLVLAGGFAVAVGVWVGFVGTFSVGLGLVGIGSCCLSAGVVLVAERDESEWEAEERRWMEKWGSQWLPACPVHGRNLCYTRSERCPGSRHRVPE